MSPTWQSPAIARYRAEGLTDVGEDLSRWVEPYRAARSEVARVAAARRAEAIAAGGLAAFGVGRSTSRPTNDWLRSRAGEPGETRFLRSAEEPHLAGLKVGWSGATVRLRANQAVSLDDRKTHGKRLKRTIADRDASAETAAIERRLEGWRYESVLDSQRRQVRSLREKIRDADNTRDLVAKIIHGLVDEAFPDEPVGAAPARTQIEDITGRDSAEIAERATHSRATIKDYIHRAYSRRETEVGPSIMRELERKVLLTNLDLSWYEHLNWLRYAATHARDLFPGGDSLSEYRRDSEDRYARMMRAFRRDSLKYLFRLHVEQ